MNFHVRKSSLSGAVTIPGSKSHTIRGLVCATLAKGKSVLLEPLVSDDTQACINACRSFGAAIDIGPEGRRITVTGTGGNLQSPGNVVDVLNSGTTLYFAMGMAAAIDGWTFLTGDEQIRSRPAGELLRALNELKAFAFSSRDNGKAPLAVRGAAGGGKISLRAKTSQYLSSLLISAPLFRKKTAIRLLLLNEKPYIDMTLSWLNECGVKVSHRDYKVFEIPPNQHYRAFRKKIPADFSSAAFFVVAAALFADRKVVIGGLDMNDVQGDKEIVSILRRMNASIEESGNKLVIRRSFLKGTAIDIKNIPDLLPILSVAGCYAEGETVIYNGEHVREKETDRISVMARELRKMGARVTETPGGLVVKRSALKAAEVCGHGDHRVIMSLSVAAAGASGAVTRIKDTDAVSVTFPNFFDLMKSLGAKITRDER
jgi:3-phosphoshikimate 1-carboxyvinyltransferase